MLCQGMRCFGMQFLFESPRADRWKQRNVMGGRTCKALTESRTSRLGLVRSCLWSCGLSLCRLAAACAAFAFVICSALSARQLPGAKKECFQSCLAFRWMIRRLRLAWSLAAGAVRTTRVLMKSGSSEPHCEDLRVRVVGVGGRRGLCGQHHSRSRDDVGKPVS